jgi:DnaK suppressor protein
MTSTGSGPNCPTGPGDLGSLDRSALDQFKRQLEDMRDQMTTQVDQSQSTTDTVELDQSKVGRLSRMDALQMQAMAQASQERRRILLQRIDAALQRIAGGEFGYCAACEEPIAQGRLQADPATPLCIDCANQATG